MSLQSCPTLCDPIDHSPLSSPIPGILQARTLEWVSMSFSSAWKWKVKVKSLSRVWPSATLWTAAYQAPPSMGFSRQGYWSGLVKFFSLSPYLFMAQQKFIIKHFLFFCFLWIAFLNFEVPNPQSFPSQMAYKLHLLCLFLGSIFLFNPSPNVHNWTWFSPFNLPHVITLQMVWLAGLTSLVELCRSWEILKHLIRVHKW